MKKFCCLLTLILFSSYANSKTSFDLPDLREFSKYYDQDKKETVVTAYTLMSDPCVTVIYKDKEKRYCQVTKVTHLADLYPFSYITKLDTFDNYVYFTVTNTMRDLNCEIDAELEKVSCKGRK